MPIKVKFVRDEDPQVLSDMSHFTVIDQGIIPVEQKPL